MGKLLRNLGILIIVIIIAGAAFFFYNGGKLSQLSSISDIVPSGKKVSLDAGYGEILAIFNNNDVNIVNVQNLGVVGVTSDNAVVWVENKANLQKVSSQLTDYSKNISSRAESADVAGELSDAAKLYSAAIGFELNNGAYLENLAKQTNVSGDCSNLNYFLDLNANAYRTYAELDALANQNDAFLLNHEMFAQPLVIDLDGQRAAVSDTEAIVADMKQRCSGGTA